MPKEELLQFEGLVTEILPDARYRVQLDNGHRRLHRRTNEEESDQNPGRGSRDGRSITLRFGKGAIDLPPQGRTRRIAEPSAAASPIPAALTGNGLLMIRTTRQFVTGPGKTTIVCDSSHGAEQIFVGLFPVLALSGRATMSD